MMMVVSSCADLMVQILEWLELFRRNKMVCSVMMRGEMLEQRGSRMLWMLKFFRLHTGVFTLEHSYFFKQLQGVSRCSFCLLLLLLLLHYGTRDGVTIVDRFRGTRLGLHLLLGTVIGR